MTTQQDTLTFETVDRSKLSPMMLQYLDQKDRMPDAILMFRLGDFYEMFFDDAVTASRELELALTGRDCGLDKRAPMCGVPHHAAASYMQKLVAHGYKVAICDQMEDPALAKGIVRRAITRVLTPGTITDSSALDDKKNNYILCIYRLGMQYGMAACDITTGAFEALRFVTGNTSAKLLNQIARYQPSEIICNGAFANDPLFTFITGQYQVMITVRADADFSANKLASYSTIIQEKHSSRDSSWTMDKVFDSLHQSAAGALLSYLEETQQSPISHLRELVLLRIEDTMELDAATRRNLEITETIRSKSHVGSLLWAVDRTKTAMGGRLFRKWLEQPLLVKEDIQARQEAVGEAKDSFLLRSEIRELITGIHDLERLAARISLGSVNARDLLSLRNSLAKLPNIKDQLARFSSGLFCELNRSFDCLEDIYQLLKDALDEEPPISIKEGNLFRAGYHDEIDRLRVASTDGKSLILEIEAKEKEKTGIRTMKVGYNRVFGYYLEVSKGNLNSVPEYFIRKQTLTNAERFITEELKSIEDSIVGAQQKMLTLEYDMFVALRNQVADQTPRLQSTAQAIAALDVLSALGELADREKYVCPQICDEQILDIRQGRHPVVERVLTAGNFVPNDTLINEDERRIMILTGPNMAGKSTYMRQVALIVLMAQMGSFIPAESAQIGIVDRIFTRIGASDDLSSGQSTFMVEMNEVSTILRNATGRSLLLLDEVGRGTSTYDGLAIAWAILEFLGDPEVVFARTLFATHYHELNMLEKQISGIFNAHVEVEEKDQEVIFLHRISDGGTDDSYGIEVARLAGVPAEVVSRAKEILSLLEKEKRIQGAPIHDHFDSSDTTLPSADPMVGQLELFAKKTKYSMRENPIRQELRDLDISKMTPLEAMNVLYSFIEKSKIDES